MTRSKATNSMSSQMLKHVQQISTQSRWKPWSFVSQS